MALVVSTRVTPNTARLMRWKKILTVLQGNGSAVKRNNPQPGDTLRETLVKVLRSLNNSNGA